MWTRVEVILNTTTIVAIIATGILIGRSQFPRAEHKKITAQPEIGKTVRLRQVDWSRNKTTLLLVLAEQCGYCKASLPFYRELLSSSNQRRTFKTVAVFPQSAPEGRKYLHANGVEVDTVEGGLQDELPVSGTPTLIIVDSLGHVQAFWVGLLKPEQEDQVFANLGMRRDSWADLIRTSAAEAVLQLRMDIATRVIDTRSRDAFLKAHIAGAINIPLHEIDARARESLPQNSSVILVCGDCAPSAARLRRNGFRSVRVLAASVDDLPRELLERSIEKRQTQTSR